MNYRFVSLLVLPLALAACSDDSAAPNVGTLSRAEAVMLASAVSGSVAPASEMPTANSADRTAADPMTFTQDHESTHPCPKGGTVTLKFRASGQVDIATGTIKLDVAGTNKPAACAYMHEAITLTLDGDPSLSFETHAAIENQAPADPFTVKINGAFKWSASDGRTGRCAIEVLEVTDFAAKKRTVEGSVCGHTVKETLTWS